MDKFIEVSTAQVYEAGKKKSKEGDKCDPWTGIASISSRLRRINAGSRTFPSSLSALSTSMDLVTLPPCVCSPSALLLSHQSLRSSSHLLVAPRIICGAVHKQLNERMQFLWYEVLKINTVHVRDVVKALWHLSQKGTVGSIYNLCDKGETGTHPIPFSIVSYPYPSSLFWRTSICILKPSS